MIPHFATIDMARKYMNVNIIATTSHSVINVAPVAIELEDLSATSVRVSWDRLDIPEITGYIVYYNQTGNSEMVIIQH